MNSHLNFNGVGMNTYVLFILHENMHRDWITIVFNSYRKDVTCKTNGKLSFYNDMEMDSKNSKGGIWFKN